MKRWVNLVFLGLTPVVGSCAPACLSTPLAQTHDPVGITFAVTRIDCDTLAKEISISVNAIRDGELASPTFNYLFSTAYGIFRTVFAEVIRDYGTGEGLAKRAASMADRLLAERGHHEELDSVAEILKDGEPQAFNFFYRTYFATDLFPENAARFPLAYVEVKADAEGYGSGEIDHKRSLAKFLQGGR